MKIKTGDYVVSTKWPDGHGADPWGVGFFSHVSGGRIFIVDNNGVSLRASGYRRARKISRERGDYLLQNAEDIELSGLSVWHFLRVNID